MNPMRRQLMRPSATATPLAVAAAHLSASYSLHGQLTNEVQNGVSIARTYDSLNRPTGYSLMHDAQCTMVVAPTLHPFNPSTFQPSLTPTTPSAVSAGLVLTQRHREAELISITPISPAPTSSPVTPPQQLRREAAATSAAPPPKPRREAA